jgi:hypothetical protein
MALSNELYMAVLPMVHLGINQYGLTEQVITLLPDRKQATDFFPMRFRTTSTSSSEEPSTSSVGTSLGTHLNRSRLTLGRVIVRVYQHVF